MTAIPADAHEIQTLYGYSIWLRKITLSQFLKAQPLFAPPVEVPGKGYRDPLGCGFADVDCPACESPRGKACVAFADERLPHDGRIGTAHAVRSVRGMRGILRFAVVHPEPTDDFLRRLEEDQVALKHFNDQAMEFLNLTGKAKEKVAGTFREGAVGPVAPDPEAPDRAAAVPPVPDCP